MNTKHILITIVACVIVGSISFYGGMQYQQSKLPAGVRQFAQAGARQQGGAGGRAFVRGGAGGGFVSGDVISKDDKSVTIKTQDGGSKIVFTSGSTTVGKMVEGTMDDLQAGTSVTVIGQTNADGSVTAESIQIRPAGMLGGMRNASSTDATATSTK